MSADDAPPGTDSRKEVSDFLPLERTAKRLQSEQFEGQNVCAGEAGR